MLTEAHWLQICLGWLGNILSRLIERWSHRKPSEPKYFNITQSNTVKSFTIKGELPKTVDIEKIVKILYGKNK